MSTTQTTTTEPFAVHNARALLDRLTTVGTDDTARHHGWDSDRPADAFMVGYLQGALEGLLDEYDREVGR